MKKFLSLVLALVMTMSLFTISAGATEYKDLTDKDKIQYPEAVAVLNKLGIITGYEDGSFNPTGSLTRGAAAKIIVSLMIGPSAASSLTVAAAPYKDVPVDNTFAAYISYCKTAGYISGYSDGTFRPTGTLTGYAFAKMLLGALGYKSDVEGFTGDGWTMNVAKIGNLANLFDTITSFNGNTAVTREVACQMALNTLKATEVEYAGNDVSVTTGSATVVVGNTKATPVTSTNSDYNANIDSTTYYNGTLTVQFGEEHFKDLKMVSSAAADDFQRPSNQWSYKNVTVGTYAKTPTYTFTAGTGSSDNTATQNASALNISGYSMNTTSAVKTSVTTATTGIFNVSINGTTYAVQLGQGTDTTTTSTKTTLADYISSLTANGRKVEIYTSTTTADLISNIVVVDTYLAKVNSVNTSSKKVTLKAVSSSVDLANSSVSYSWTVESTDNDNYAALAAAGKDALVLVTAAGTKVESVATPTTVTGKISTVSLNSKSAVNGVSLSGTAYKLSKQFYSEKQLTTSCVSTSVTSTAYVDSYGYVIYLKDMSASTNYILVKSVASTVVNDQIVYIAKGYDMSGNALSLNLGTDATHAVDTDAVANGATDDTTIIAANRVYAYSTSNTANDAEYVLLDTAVTAAKYDTITSTITSGQSKLAGYYFASSVSFMFVSHSSGTTVSGVTVKSGVQTVSASTLMYYTVNSDNYISNVIVMTDTDATTTANLLYVSAQTGTTTNAAGKSANLYTVYIDGVETKGVISTASGMAGSFATYSKDSTTGEYTMNAYTTASNTSTAVVTGAYVTSVSGNYFQVNGVTGTDYNASSAQIIDLSSNNITSLSEIKDLNTAKLGSVKVAFVYNDGTSSSKGTVSYLFVTDVAAAATQYALTAQTSGVTFYSDAACTTAIGSAAAGTTVYMKASAVNLTISSTNGYGITVDTAAAPAVTEIAHFTMPTATVVAGEFTEA